MKALILLALGACLMADNASAQSCRFYRLSGPDTLTSLSARMDAATGLLEWTANSKPDWLTVQTCASFHAAGNGDWVNLVKIWPAGQAGTLATPAKDDTGVLVAHYPLDGNATDITGNGKNGTIQGATPVSDRFDVADHAYSFGGQDYISLTANRPLSRVKNSFTIAAWFKPAELYDSVIYIHRADWRDVIINWNWKSGHGQTVGFQIYSGVQQGHCLESGTVSLNAWHHVAATYDGTTQRLYIDGAEVASAPLQISVDWDKDFVAEGIGGYLDNPDDRFKGAIDDVRIYDRALPASEVRQLHPYGNPPPGFRVLGDQLLDANGNPFMIRGINHGYCWNNEEGELDTAVRAIAATGANTVRVVMSTGQAKNPSTGELWDATGENQVRDIINAVKQQQMIAVLEVLDCKGYGDKTEPDAFPLSAAVYYWTHTVKDALANQEPYVIINIANEPFGNSVSAGDYLTETKNAIIQLRDAGLHHTLMVDGADYGQDYQENLDSTHLHIMRDHAAEILEADPDRNVIFSVHMYGVYSDKTIIEEYLKAFHDDHRALVVGEFATVSPPSPLPGYPGSADVADIMRLAAKYQQGYMGWLWHGDGFGFDLATDLSGCLTDWGKLLINGDSGDGVCHLYGIKGSSSRASVYPTPTQPLLSTSAPSVPEGGTAALNVRLNKAPEASLTVNVVRTCGDADLSVASGATLTFTPENWSTPQTVTLAAAQDADSENGTATFTISASDPAIPSLTLTATEADIDARPTAGLVAYYPFEGTCNNGVPGGPNGTPTATVTFSSPGVVGQAVNLTATDQPSIELGSSSALLGNQQLTFAYWVYFTELTATSYFMINNYDGEGWVDGDIIIREDLKTDKQKWDHGICAQYGVGSESGYSVDFDAQLPTGVWTHLAVVFNTLAAAATDRVRLFKNGVEITTKEVTSTAIPGGQLLGNNSANLRLGRALSGDWPLHGYLDEVHIYRSALSGTEILQLYNIH